MGLGLVSGLFGALFINITRAIIKFRRDNKKYVFFKNRWIYTGTLCFVMGNIIYYTDFMKVSDKSVITSMFHYENSKNITMKDQNITNSLDFDDFIH